jgi:hypothetical protein
MMAQIHYKTREEAFAQLDRIAGTWIDQDGSKSTYKWMDGHNFMMVKMDGGIMMIGYDEESGLLKSHFFAGSRDTLENGGKPIRYVYNIQGEDFELALDSSMPDRHGSFIAKLTDNDTKLSGRWDWVQNGEKMGYDSVATKQQV